MSFQEIYILLKYKIKLLFRDNYDSKIVFKYYIVFLPMYAYMIYVLHFYQNFFFTISIFSIIILGLDYHSITNKSNINSISLFCLTNDKKKSMFLSLVIDFLFKFLLLIPVLIFSKSIILCFLYCIVFILFSYLFKELVIRSALHKIFYSLLFFIFVFISNIFGNFLLDDLREKQIQRIQWFKLNFDIVYSSTIFCLVFFVFVLFLVFNKYFDKIKS